MFASPLFAPSMAAPVCGLRLRDGVPMSAESDAGRHIPVMLAEVLAALQPKHGGVIIDGTFGAGGYSRGILDEAPGATVIAIDRDPSALAAGAAMAGAFPGRLILAEGTFSALDEIAEEAGFPEVDGVTLDIGVSSMQLDQAQRGFSFRMEGPLDMRMGGTGPSAADIVADADEEELADIIYHYGEERRSRAVARAIVKARAEAPITTTKRLAEIVASVVRAEPGGINPATRTFQGLRIAVNDELGEIAKALHAAERVLKPGGRLAVVTFHSLEDRIVKQFLAKRAGRAPAASRHAPAAGQEAATFRLVGKQPLAPGHAETKANPRARSAKLRVAERTDAPAQAPDPDIMALASLPERRGGRR